MYDAKAESKDHEGNRIDLPRARPSKDKNPEKIVVF
jgi:hypothetical protein